MMHEFELLEAIYASSKHLDSTITIGPGDDMGEVCLGDQKILLAVDHLVVGRHVEPNLDPAIIGRKAIARCFSDIAAMCGQPAGSLMTACLPKTISNEWAKSVFDSARKAAEEWGGPLLGGDISTAEIEHAIFTVSAIATPPSSGAIMRNGAQIGDLVCVTGEFGNSIKQHHLAFTPRIEEAKQIYAELGESLHAMIDVSDGLAQDASHIATENSQIKIHTHSIPLRNGATIENALQDGEDYELLFTCSAQPSHPLTTVIGEVTERKQGDPEVVDENWNPIEISGWVHK